MSRKTRRSMLAAAPLVLALVALAAAAPQRSTSRRTSDNERIEKLERAVHVLQARTDQLASDLDAARGLAVNAREEAESAVEEAETARAASDALGERLDDLTSGITIAGDVLTVRQVNAQLVLVDRIEASEYAPGAGNVW